MATGWPMKVTYANGDVYSASDVNDTNGTINLLGKSVAYTAGKNRIINGDFGVWQRGTSFTLVSNTLTYGADRHYAYCTIASGTTTLSRQTFTPGAAPISGYEGSFYRRLVCSAGTSAAFNAQRIEDVRTYAGQTITFSFFAKASSSNSATIYFTQNFGSGGSASVDTTSTVTIGTSWARYTITVTLPSISGKTIGTSSFLDIAMSYGSPASLTIEDWGWQVEIGSTATAFQTATGTIQGELAACQRYYWRTSSDGSNYTIFGFGSGLNANQVQALIKPAVTMRITPSTLDSANIAIYDGLAVVSSPTGLSIIADNSNKDQVCIQFTKNTFITAYRPYQMLANNSTAAYIGLSAEL
jgi:hypothetical protein